MNLFLLTAVPLAAVALHRFLYPARSVFGDAKSWILGGVWAVVSLVLASFFGGARVFSGDLWGAFLGLTFTDVLLVPGVVVAAWVLTRPNRDPGELGLWMALVFTMAGIRDFASTSRIFDLTELFLVPLDRIFLIVVTPGLAVRIFGATVPRSRWTWTAMAGVLALSGSLFPVLSFGRLGWLVWALEIMGIATFFFLERRSGQKKAASLGSGSVPGRGTTAAVPPVQP